MIGGDNEDVIVEEEGVGDIYIQLNLTTNSKAGTRAGLGDDHPYGGENGDGTEEGHFHENDINNITIFIYNDAEGNGINDVESTPIKFKKYFTTLDLQKLTDGSYETKPLLIHGYKSALNDRIIVLVNMGDQTGLATLKSVRDKLISTAWGTSGSSIQDYYNFAMASAVDDATYGKVILINPGTYDSPFSAAVKVERLAARIDFGFDKSLEASSYRGYIEYPVEGITGDKFRLSHIRLVNASQAPTYALKRTASTVNPLDLDDVKYLGDETVVSGTRIPNNYVVEPNTTKKKKDASITEAELSSWYGASTLQASLSTSFIASNAYKVHSTKTTASDAEVFEVSDLNSTKNYCYTLGYAMENTMDKSCSDARVMTALQIKGTYVPAKVYVYVDDETKSYKEESSTPYTPGTDFWYFDNQTTPANSYPFVSQADLLAYAAKHPTDDYIERHYVKGECYYYVWIRHSMYSDPTYKSGSFPMEFGIVRNNIYRIYVDKVMKIGPEVPNPELPDLVSSHIHVRDWRLRIHEDILL